MPSRFEGVSGLPPTVNTKLAVGRWKQSADSNALIVSKSTETESLIRIQK